MFTCQLTKLESALDALRKTHPKLPPADAALLVTALTLTGRHALALYEGEQYVWPDDYERLTMAMVPHIKSVTEAVEGTVTKKPTKAAAAEEEPVNITIGLMPNLTAGENLLDGRDDLKTLLSDILQEGVEFSYASTDLGWQWALDRANWTTIAGGDTSRRIKVKAGFTEGAVGIETGTGAPKKRKAPAAKPVVAEEPEAAETEEPVETEA